MALISLDLAIVGSSMSCTLFIMAGVVQMILLEGKTFWVVMAGMLRHCFFRFSFL